MLNAKAIDGVEGLIGSGNLLKHMNMELLKVKGQLRLYRRKPESGRPRYVVMHADGRVLEEFRRQKPAVLWMKTQKESTVPKTLRDGEVCDLCRNILTVGDAGISTPAGKFVCRVCFDIHLPD